ncbi:MAG: O-antigen ligase family protein [Bacteroidales bacterium]|nr:O-antigen ligase family protein [Bacteroidales bacterium]
MKNKFVKYYLGSIILLFIGLAFSKIIISLSQIALLVIWIFEGDFNQKFKNLKQNKAALIFLSIFGLFIIGMLWTNNLKAGLNELKLKLPLFILPFIFSTITHFSKKELQIILSAFVFVVFSKTIESSFFIIGGKFSPSLEQISNKISHIRYSLMIDFAIFSIIYIITSYKKTKTKYKILSLSLIVWFLAFLIFIQSLTGIIILFLLVIGLGIYFISKSNKISIKITSLIIVLFLIFSTSIYLYNQYKNFYTIKDPNFNSLPQYTESGNEYYHNIDNFRFENGHHVGYFYCKKEIEQEWNKISHVKFNQKGSNGFLIKFTIVRYMTSLGLPKDSVGVSKLTPTDIANIEKGLSNYKFANTLSISNRIYKVIWQIHEYKNTKDANNQSITQRYEYLLTSFEIIQKNLFLGVGTGDVKDAFKQQYIEDNSILKEKNRRRSHNQLVTFILTLGIILGTWCIIALFLPFIINKKHAEFLPTIFLVISILSMLTDNTLETSISVSFFAVFYSLLILQITEKKSNIDN